MSAAAAMVAAAASTPIPTIPRPTPATILSWDADDASCGQTTLKPLSVPPTAVAAQTIGPEFIEQLPIAAKEVVLRFAITPSGRTVSVARAALLDARVHPITPMLMARLAATTFARGSPQPFCRVTYRLHQTAVADALIDLAINAVNETTQGRARDAVFARIFPNYGGSCASTEPKAVMISVSQIAEINRNTPVPDRYAVQYDVDGAGRARNIRMVIAPTDHRIAAEVVRSYQASRYVLVPLKNCMFVQWWTRKQPLPAPEREISLLKPSPTASCPRQVQRLLLIPDAPFPAEARYHSIEGWAVVRFDIAADGRAVNAVAIGAQPMASFGDAAVDLIEQSRLRQATGVAMQGCVAPVVYSLSNPGND